MPRDGKGHTRWMFGFASMVPRDFTSVLPFVSYLAAAYLRPHCGEPHPTGWRDREPRSDLELPATPRSRGAHNEEDETPLSNALHSSGGLELSRPKASSRYSIVSG